MTSSNTKFQWHVLEEDQRESINHWHLLIETHLITIDFTIHHHWTTGCSVRGWLQETAWGWLQRYWRWEWFCFRHFYSRVIGNTNFWECADSVIIHTSLSLSLKLLKLESWHLSTQTLHIKCCSIQFSFTFCNWGLIYRDDVIHPHSELV